MSVSVEQLVERVALPPVLCAMPGKFPEVKVDIVLRMHKAAGRKIEKYLGKRPLDSKRYAQQRSETAGRNNGHAVPGSPSFRRRRIQGGLLHLESA